MRFAWTLGLVCRGGARKRPVSVLSVEKGEGMDEYSFDDALASSAVTCTFPHLEAVRLHGSSKAQTCPSLFFPGCSFINYGLPLVQAVYDLLKEAGRVEGISLVCCGMILGYEPNADEVRPAFEQQLRDRIVACGVERIVTACPNCVYALRALLAREERTAQVQVVVLPSELVELGYRVDPDVARKMLQVEEALRAAEGARAADPGPAESANLAADAGSAESAGAAADAAADAGGAAGAVDTDGAALFCVHDSCPDRATGEIAESLRALMPIELIVDPAHNRKRSFCCGSRPRAVGRVEAADRMARRHAEEAQDVRARALLTACVSCSFQLTVAQRDLPVFHYLELLFDWRIDWREAERFMKLRFLFDSALGAREFVGLSAPEGAFDEGAAICTAKAQGGADERD